MVTRIRPVSLNWKIIVSAVAMALTPVAGAHADKLTCDAVDSVAKIGFPSTSDVGEEHDEDKDICSWSIDGHSAGSPPTRDIVDGFRLIVENLAKPGGLPYADSGVFDAIAAAIFSASRDSVVPPEIVSFLRQHAEELNRCLSPEYRGSQTASNGSYSLFCARVVEAGGFGDNGFANWRGSELSPGRLIISVHDGSRDRRNTLFLSQITVDFARARQTKWNNPNFLNLFPPQ